MRGVPMAVVVLALGFWMEHGTALTLAAQIVAGAVTYGATLLIVAGRRLQALRTTLRKR